MSDLDVDVFDLLERSGVEQVSPASGGSEASFCCPLHTEERPSAYMNVETGLWWCHGCHQRGNIVGFVSKVMGVSYSTASMWLREAYGVDFREPEGGSMTMEVDAWFQEAPEMPLLRRPDESVLERFIGDLYSDEGTHAYEYARSRGFSPESITHWSLGYDRMSDRLMVPTRDARGFLVGFKGRALRPEQEPRFLIIGDGRRHPYGFDQYEASQVVFGLHRARGFDRVVLCESELDAVALEQSGVARPCALGMSFLTEMHAKILIEECREVVLFLDSDASGREGVYGHVGSDGRKSAGAIERLERHVVVRMVESHDRDPAAMLRDGDGDELPRMIYRASHVLVDSIVLR